MNERKTPLPGPVVHATSPYTWQRWRMDVSFFFRLYKRTLRHIWSDHGSASVWGNSP